MRFHRSQERSGRRAGSGYFSGVSRTPYRRRRIAAALIVTLQLLLVVRAYEADHAVFGFQMFPESSDWQADIVRVTADGARVDARLPWPGGYRWGDLVRGRGLTDPFVRHHADTGLDSQLHFFEEALDWVAANTPLDTETQYLEATVTVWPNGGGPEVLVFSSDRRVAP